MDEDASEFTELVARRSDVLDHLVDRTDDKRDLTSALSCSRSTVDRAIRDLREAGLIRRTADGYTVTMTGRVALETHLEYREDMADVREATAVLESLPPSAPIDRRLLAGADASLTEGPLPRQPLRRLHDAFREADRYRSLLPRLTELSMVQFCRERVVEEGLATTIVFRPELLERLVEEFGDDLAAMAAEGRFGAYAGAIPPFTLGLTERDGEVVVWVIVYTEGDAIRGLLRNDTAAAVEWAESLFERHRVGATDVTHRCHAGSAERKPGGDEPDAVVRED